MVFKTSEISISHCTVRVRPLRTASTPSLSKDNPVLNSPSPINSSKLQKCGLQELLPSLWAYCEMRVCKWAAAGNQLQRLQWATGQGCQMNAACCDKATAIWKWMKGGDIPVANGMANKPMKNKETPVKSTGCQ